MDYNFAEYQKFIGTQLKGAVVEDIIGQKVFKRYALSPESIKFLRKNIVGIPIQVILPHTSYKDHDLIEKLSIVINENFVITNIHN